MSCRKAVAMCHAVCGMRVSGVGKLFLVGRRSRISDSARMRHVERLLMHSRLVLVRFDPPYGD